MAPGLQTKMVSLLTVIAGVRGSAFSRGFSSRPNSPGKCKEDQMIPMILLVVED